MDCIAWIGLAAIAALSGVLCWLVWRYRKRSRYEPDVNDLGFPR